MRKTGILIFLLMALIARPQGLTVEVSGIVFDLSGNGQVSIGAEVEIMIDSTNIGYSYSNIVLTDSTGGFYDFISLSPEIQEAVLTVRTYDTCKNVFLEYQEKITANSYYYFPFATCETLPQNCESQFFYYPTANQDEFIFEGFMINGDSAFMYDWDFGDGTGGSGQSVTHSFPPDSNQSYLVCLTTGVIEPTGDTCYFESCKEVFLNISPECTADFTFEIDPGNNMTILFEDLSTTGSGGSPTNWIWDFGDGNVSLDQNPSHTYYAPGTYTVCLLILDSIELCSAISCQDIIVGDSLIPIAASFTTSLDSLTSEPNRYFFNSTSTGEIMSWNWDFGDGNTAQGEQVIHQFEESGIYTVCLTVEGQGYGGIETDTYCMDIATPEYTYFGGQVFAGNYPLNNPVPTGDTGIAHLYKINENLLVPIDTNVFTNEGLYVFNHLLNGSYLIKVALAENSTNYGNYFPTYYPDRITWQESQMMTLMEPAYATNVHLVPVENLPSGPGSISGKVAISNVKEEQSPLILENIEVILFDDSGSPLTFTYTDWSGTFEFSELPYNTYRVAADHTGWTSTSMMVTLGPSNITVDNVGLDLSLEGSYSIDEPELPDDIMLKVYPNPARDILHIEFSSKGSNNYRMVILDMIGNIVEESEIYTSSDTKTSFRVGYLPKGIYLLRVISGDGSQTGVKRFIKQ